MNTTTRQWAPREAAPPQLYWALLALVLAVHLLFGPWPAVVLGGLVALQIMRPLHFLHSYLLVVGGGSFVDYSQGNLTREISILSVGILFMLFCYFINHRSRLLSVPRTGMTIPVALYLGLTLLNFVRGAVIGNSLRYAGLELIAALAMACVYLIGNVRMTHGTILTAVIAISAIALGNSVNGFHEFSIARQRVGSVYFTAVPGLVALVLFNFALREERLRRAALWILPLVPLLAHQFLSFTRGFWLGLSGGILYSLIAYGGRSPGARERWRRAAQVTALVLVPAFCAVLVIAGVFGISNLLDLAASRLSSSAGTQLTHETSSNIVRLVEYVRVVQDIIASPWIGHGLGHYFVVREPLQAELFEQWYCHQSYLMVWLKQGIIGLALFIGVLWAALRTAHVGAREHAGWQGAWCAATAAITVFVVIYSTVYFVLVAEVNTAFLIALMWGGTMSIVARGNWALRWGPRAPGTAPQRRND